MNDIYENSPHKLEPLNDRLDMLVIELELAVKWHRPSILLAVYPAEDIHAEAEAALENKIFGFGHKVIHIRGEEGRDLDLSLLVSRIPDAEKVVFFVDGLNRGGESAACNIYRTLNVSREYFVEKQIRIVFWLTEAEAVSLAHFAPDFWASRHRVVDFIELEKPERNVVGATEPAWQGQGEYKHMNDNLVNTPPKISLRETTQAGLPEWDGSTTAGVNLLLTLGIMHWRKGDADKANESLRSALEIAIKTQDKRLEAVCFNAIALVKTDLGMLDEAVEAYEQAIELAPEKTFIWGHLGNLYSRLGLYAEAVEAFLNTLEHNPVDAIVWNSLGNAYVNTGRLDDAIESYRKAVELNDNFIEPWISLGSLFKRQNLSGDAIKAFQKAAGLDPNNGQAWNELGNTYFELGAFAQAIDAYNMAIRLGVQSGWSYCNLASAYTFREEFASAIPFYQKGLELLDDDEDKAVAWNRLGDAYRQVKDYDNAISAYQNADKLADGGTSSNGQLSYLHSLVAGEMIPDELADAAPEQSAAPAVEQAAPIVDEPQAVESAPAAGEPVAAEAVEPVDLAEQVAEMPEPVAAETTQTEETSGLETPAPQDSPVDAGPETTLPETEAALDALSASDETAELAPAASAPDDDTVPVAAQPDPPADEPAAEASGEVAVEEAQPEPVAAAAEIEDLIETEATCVEPSEAELAPTYEAVDVVSVAAADGDEDNNDAPGQDLRNAQIWNELGNIYFKVGAYDEALDAYNKAIELGLELGLLYSNLAYACAHKGKYAEAIPLYIKAIDLLTGDDDRALGWTRLADAYVQIADLGGAMSAYGNALELDPANDALLASLNNVRDQLAALDQPEVQPDAIPAPAVAEQVEPAAQDEEDGDDSPAGEDESDDTVVAGLVSRLFAEEAVPELVSTGEAASLAVENETPEAELPTAGDAAGPADEPQSSAAPETEAVSTAREIDLKNAHIWNELGNIFAKASAFDDAIDAYNKATELDPGFGWPYSNLGLAYAQKGKFGDAVPLYQKSIECFENNKDKAISWNRLGDAYRQLNEYDNAIAAYQIADELNQDGTLPETDLHEMNVRQASPIFSYLSGGSNDRF